jgi:hypothetical protein
VKVEGCPIKIAAGAQPKQNSKHDWFFADDILNSCAPFDVVKSAAMALYYDAVKVLTDDSEQGSLKSRIYGGSGNLKSKPAQVYALISQCAKCDTLLKEVIDNAGLLEQERKVRSNVSHSSRLC